MRIRNLRDDENPKLMIIPMIDIIFFLLVFFMMSMLSMVVQKSIPVALPAAQTASVDLDRKVPVTITADGRIFVEQESMPMDAFIRRMQLEKAKGGNLSVILRSDKNVKYGEVVTVLDTLKKIGITRVSIATGQ